jgi:cation diffusion facilitator CzcD-associated flavoprotein CzcO
MDSVDVVILGAGFSGLSAAIELTRRGRSSFLVLEKADDVGGTWRDNTYPGVECDVPSHLYSLSTAPNPRWSKTYAAGAEIHAYQQEVVRRFDLADRIRLGTCARSASWSGGRWTVEATDGRVVQARHLIAGLGGLHTPNIPAFRGAESFRGPIFHTSTWDHSVQLLGRRVGMVGTGATAVQAAPEVAEIADSFHLFQRSPIWCGPKRDDPYPSDLQDDFERDPDALRAHRWELWNAWESNGADLLRAGTDANAVAEAMARRNIERNVSDPELVKLLTPTFNITCKRPTFSNRYYPMFNRDNVHLETAAIEEIVPGGIRAGGNVIPLDVIILATGFRPFDITSEIEITGIDGLNLADAWSDRITSYRSIMVHGFPNLFLLLGPNSAGLTSALQMIEAGARFAADVIDRVDERRVTGVHPTAEAVDAFTREVDGLTAQSTMNHGCTSWWSNGGTNHSLWPDSSIRYRLMLRELDDDDFVNVGGRT